MTLQQRAALARAMIIISRYRAETPLGHQPYMLAGQADEALHELNRALGAPTEQELAAVKHMMENAQGDLESIKLVQTGVGIGSPEQGPVECQYAKDVAMPEYKCVGKCQYAPPQRKPLTTDQMYAAIRPLFKTDALAEAALSISFDEYRAIEAAHNIKEKNK